MDINYLNDLEEKNIFEFIDYKLILGEGEPCYYLTGKGAFVVEGAPYGNNWSEWSDKYLEDDNKNELDNYLEELLEDDKKSWLSYYGIEDEELDTLELLRKQYLAIRDYSNNPSDELAIETIKETYSLTGINCLDYIKNLKTEEEWKELTDTQGMQICAIMTGYNPEENDKLEEMHNVYCDYINKINNLVYDKSNNGKKLILK